MNDVDKNYLKIHFQQHISLGMKYQMGFIFSRIHHWFLAQLLKQNFKLNFLIFQLSQKCSDALEDLNKIKQTKNAFKCNSENSFSQQCSYSSKACGKKRFIRHFVIRHLLSLNPKFRIFQLVLNIRLLFLNICHAVLSICHLVSNICHLALNICHFVLNFSS